MKPVIIEENPKKNKYQKFIDWLIHMLGYSLILISMSVLFKNTIYIDNNLFGLWAFIASIIIYILNKTIKPILVWLTLPITALTLGLFYPFINVFILEIVAWLLNDHFNIPGGIFMVLIVAILISVMNILMESIIESLLRKES